MARIRILFAVMLAIAVAAIGCRSAKQESAPQSLEPRPLLNLPLDSRGRIPARLSLTGAFKDLRTLTPADGVIPYEINLSFWSDSAVKSRWMALPPGTRIGFAAAGEWTFPPGTILIKHFDFATDARRPEQMRRLETRLIVVGTAGAYGVTYKWRSDGSDADLLRGNTTETLTIQTPAGPQKQIWYYPAGIDCQACHTALAGKALGPSTRQMNCDITDPATGQMENQLSAWNRAGRFKPAISEADFPKLAKLAAPSDKSRSLEDRARSWLDANCSSCHRPGGVPARFDARYETPLARQNLIDGPVFNNLGIGRARLIAPGDPSRSVVLQRVNTTQLFKMPPLARETIDGQGAALLREWILSLASPPAQPASPPSPATASAG